MVKLIVSSSLTKPGSISPDLTFHIRGYDYPKSSSDEWAPTEETHICLRRKIATYDPKSSLVERILSNLSYNCLRMLISVYLLLFVFVFFSNPLSRSCSSHKRAALNV